MNAAPIAALLMERRFRGEFFTPPLWAREANEEVARVLGEDWRRECLVWDCAAGTGNLTRDYLDWGCLLSSTLEGTDVKVMQEQAWGGEHVFKHDFLNPEPLPLQVKATLQAAAAEGKRLVFFINPPYGTAGNAGTKGTSKEGIAKTVVNEEMKAAKLGLPSQQLYAQFMFRCRKVAEEYGFADYTVALFSVPTFMSSGSYKKLRNWWYGSHEYKGGFLLQASHFADVSGRWGISFTVWNSGGTTSNSADLPIRLTDERDFAVVTDGIKQVYNSDGREASKWVEGQQTGHVGDTPKFSSGLKVAEKWSGGSVPGSLGVLASIGNNVMKSGTDVYFMSGKPTHKGARHRDLLPSNWRRAVALYGARKLVGENWINQKDEYLTPDTTLPGYEQWVDDCHVYALLHTSNNCTAMRDVQYKGKSWRIKNNWFWLTRAEARDLLDIPEASTIWRDVRGEAKDAYFAQVLSGLNLSPDAVALLGQVRSLWVESLPYREDFAAANPHLHLTAHDAGIYQIKHLWKELFPKKWKGLVGARRALAGRLAEGVYTYGFLKKLGG